MDRNITGDYKPEPGNKSPPARVAWIETCEIFTRPAPDGVATREGGVDRNKNPQAKRFRALRSPPARVAWIETLIKLS